MYALTRVDSNEGDTILSALPFLTGIGTYNTLPQPCVEITAQQYWHTFSTYSPTHSDYRQVRDMPGAKYGFSNINISWFEDRGIGVFVPHEGENRYFRFGCEHKFVGMSQAECKAAGIPHYGKCYRVSKCSVCGIVDAVDSSD